MRLEPIGVSLNEFVVDLPAAPRGLPALPAAAGAACELGLRGGKGVGWLAYSAEELGVIAGAGPPNPSFAGHSLDTDGGANWFAAGVDPTYQQGWINLVPGLGAPGTLIPIGRDADGGTVVSVVIGNGAPSTANVDLGNGVTVGNPPGGAFVARFAP